MPSKDIKILEYNQYLKCNKMPYINFASLESLIKRIDRCKNNPEKSSKTKIGQHISCRYSVCTICVFDRMKTKHNVYINV